MTQKEKDLLLKDLCGRLPYGVKCQFKDELLIFDVEANPYYDYVISERDIDLFRNNKDFYIKPYLRSMSSMTEEEMEELNCLCYHNIDIQDGMLCGYICAGEINDVIDWLNAHHFDYRGLIPKGLAIEVTEKNNSYND